MASFPLKLEDKQRLLWEVFFLIPITVTVAFLGNLSSVDVVYTWITSIFFAVNLLTRFIIVRERGDLIFFLLGVLAGGGNDLLSMLNGVYNYTSITIIPALNGLLPLWMICFWGQVFLLFRKVFHLDWFKGEGFKKDGRFLKGWLSVSLIVDIIVLVVLRVAVYNTYLLDPIISTSIYGITIIARMLIIRPKRNQLSIIAILPYAFIFEGLMVSFGLYVYHHPVFLGMPMWLILWWVFLVPFLLKHVFDMIEFVLNKREEKSRGDA